MADLLSNKDNDKTNVQSATVRTLSREILQPDDEAHVTVKRIQNHHDTSAHDHVFHELVYIESGTADHITAQGQEKIGAGTIIVIRPQVWHAYKNAKNLTLINCLFDDRLITRFADLLEPVPGSFELYRKRASRPRSEPPTTFTCPVEQRGMILERLDSIEQERISYHPGWQLSVTASLMDILLTVARVYSEGAGAEFAKLAPRTEQAVQELVLYLEQNYTAQVNLNKLARRVHLSHYHLSRCFSKRMGMSIVQFVHRLRIEQACRQLRMSKDPISEIAASVGYNEIAYFTRCFTSQIGYSPRQYRQMQSASHQ